MVVSSSTRLLDSLSHRSVPAWLTAPQASLQPTVAVIQGILAWQTTAEELLATVRRHARQSAAMATTTKLWTGYSADSFGRNSWYAVGSVRSMPRARGDRDRRQIAPPGTVLDIKPNGVVVAVKHGSVRLTNFLTPLGRPISPNQLPVTIGQRLPHLTAFQHRAIARFEANITTQESLWHKRLSQLEPLQLPQSTGEPGLGSIFARLPLDLEMATLKGSSAFQTHLAEFGGAVLLTALAGYLHSLNPHPSRIAVSQRSIGLRSNRLRQVLCSEELMALFASHVPACFAVDGDRNLDANLAIVLSELRLLEQALTHRQDLALETHDAKRPSRYPILVEMVTELSEAPHRLGQSLTIQITESGEHCAWFYNPAVLGEAEVRQLQSAFVASLAAMAKAPEKPLSYHF